MNAMQVHHDGTMKDEVISLFIARRHVIPKLLVKMSIVERKAFEDLSFLLLYDFTERHKGLYYVVCFF